MMNLLQLNDGQIKLRSPFGNSISNIATTEEYTRYLEIGTWNGGGSTVCFVDGFLKRKDTNKVTLLSLEIDKDRSISSRNRWKNLNHIVNIQHSHILDKIPTIDEMRDIFGEDINRDWLKADLDNLSLASYINVIEFNPQVVLLDGSEYLTYFEYKQLLSCPALDIIMMDDINVAKCKRIVSELDDNPDWRVIIKNTTLRNGYAIYKRVKHD